MAATTLRVYETSNILKKDAFNGSAEVDLQIVTGSRMLITLLVTAIDPATTATLYVDNSFTGENYETIENFGISSVGRVKRVLSDYHNNFKIRVVVTGGNATFQVGISTFDNAGTTRIENAQLSVSLDHTVDTLGHFDSIRIGDGVDLLQINEDGSLNVVVGEAPDEDVVSEYGSILAVPAGVDTAVLTYTVPVGRVAFLCRIDVSGENIARFDILLNGDIIATKRTYFGGNLNESFDFSATPKRGLMLEAGDVIVVRTNHGRPWAGDFEARLEVVLKG